MVASQTMAGWTEGVGRGGTSARDEAWLSFAACCGRPGRLGRTGDGRRGRRRPGVRSRPADRSLACGRPAARRDERARLHCDATRRRGRGVAAGSDPARGCRAARNDTTIRFAVAGTITLASALPAIIRPVTIDGTSAPGYRPGGAPAVAVDCHENAGLRFAGGSAGGELLGIAVNRAGGDGITLNAGPITLNGDYVGLGLAGAPAGNRGAGVYVSATSAGNFIGLNPTGQPGTVANVISANGGNGVVLASSSGNTLVANRIGTNPAGTKGMGNGGSGLVLSGRADRNEIGGTEFTNPATGQSNNPTGSKGNRTARIRGPAAGQPRLGQCPGRDPDGAWRPAQQPQRELHRHHGPRQRRPGQRRATAC